MVQAKQRLIRKSNWEIHQAKKNSSQTRNIVLQPQRTTREKGTQTDNDVLEKGVDSSNFFETYSNEFAELLQPLVLCCSLREQQLKRVLKLTMVFQRKVIPAIIFMHWTVSQGNLPGPMVSILPRRRESIDHSNAAHCWREEQLPFHLMLMNITTYS